MTIRTEPRLLALLLILDAGAMHAPKVVFESKKGLGVNDKRTLTASPRTATFPETNEGSGFTR